MKIKWSRFLIGEEYERVELVFGIIVFIYLYILCLNKELRVRIRRVELHYVRLTCYLSLTKHLVSLPWPFYPIMKAIHSILVPLLKINAIRATGGPIFQKFPFGMNLNLPIAGSWHSSVAQECRSFRLYCQALKPIFKHFCPTRVISTTTFLNSSLCLLFSFWGLWVPTARFLDVSFNVIGFY